MARSSRLLARCAGCALRRRAQALPPSRLVAASRTFSASSSSGESLDDELRRLAGYQQTSVSLKASLDTGLGLLLPRDADSTGLDVRQRTLIQIATFLRRELPVRLARRVIELQELPEGLHAMPSVQRVREWYMQSFVDIRRSRAPVDPETEAEFNDLLHKIYDRHAPTLITMARGVFELRQTMVQRQGGNFEFGDVSSIHEFLDKFYMSRIGIRILIGRARPPTETAHPLHPLHPASLPSLSLCHRALAVRSRARVQSTLSCATRSSTRATSG